MKGARYKQVDKCVCVKVVDRDYMLLRCGE